MLEQLLATAAVTYRKDLCPADDVKLTCELDTFSCGMNAAIPLSRVLPQSRLCPHSACPGINFLMENFREYVLGHGDRVHEAHFKLLVATSACRNEKLFHCFSDTTVLEEALAVENQILSWVDLFSSRKEEHSPQCSQLSQRWPLQKDRRKFGRGILFLTLRMLQADNFDIAKRLLVDNMGALHGLALLLAPPRRTKRPPRHIAYNDCRTTFWAALLQPTLANIKINEVGIFSCSTEDDGLCIRTLIPCIEAIRDAEKAVAHSVVDRRLGAITISLEKSKGSGKDET